MHLEQLLLDLHLASSCHPNFRSATQYASISPRDGAYCPLQMHGSVPAIAHGAQTRALCLKTVIADLRRPGIQSALAVLHPRWQMLVLYSISQNLGLMMKNYRLECRDLPLEGSKRGGILLEDFFFINLFFFFIY